MLDNPWSDWSFIFSLASDSWCQPKTRTLAESEVDPVWPASQCTMWQRACLNAAAANRLTSSGFSCSCVFFCLKTFDIPCLNCRSRGKTILPKKPTVVLQTCRTPSWVAGLAAIWLGGHNVIWSNRHWAHWLPKHDKKNIRKYPKCETLWGVKNCPAPSRPSGTAMDSSFAWNCMTSITVLVPQVPSSCRRALETAMQRFSAWFPKLDNLPTALSALATLAQGVCSGDSRVWDGCAKRPRLRTHENPTRQCLKLIYNLI